MDRILKLKDEYIGKKVTSAVPGAGYKVNIHSNMTQKYMNTLYDLGLSQYFEVVSSISLVDDTIEVIEDTPTAVFEGLFDITPKPEPTPTPKFKKKVVGVNPKDN